MAINKSFDLFWERRAGGSNPSTPGLAAEAEGWSRSSDAAYRGAAVADAWPAMEEWRGRWDVSGWKGCPAAGETESGFVIPGFKQACVRARPGEMPHA